MFDLTLFLAFIVAASILTVTPGLDTAMVLRAAISNGVWIAIYAAAGISLGCLVWGGAVSLGLGALLHTSEVAYTAVKWAGAGYLFWLGINLLARPRNSVALNNDGVMSKNMTALRQGFLTNILNPKVGVFYITFLPQFVPHGSNVGSYSFFLAAIHVAISLIWFSIIVVSAVPLARFLRTPKVIKFLDRLTGGVFIGFGLKLAISKA